jgi:outer membrane protein OmpA-like peptidoglycan-associated protein
MAFNLPATVNGLFTNNVISQAAKTLGESESGIEKAIGGLVPSVLSGMITRVENTGNPYGLYGMARDAAGSGILNNIGNMVEIAGTGMSNAISMASSIFGDKVNNIVSMIANYAGIKQSSASSLLNMTTPAALGVVGKYANDNDLNSTGMVNMLSNQREKILSWVPSGLNLANALGLRSVGEIGSHISGAFSAVGEATRKRINWLPLLLLLLIGGLIWFFLRTPVNEEPPVQTAAVGTPIVIEEPTVATTTPTSIKVQLPDGTELEAYGGGIEDRLVAFLNDESSKPGKDVWFDFDDLNFETGSTRLTPESRRQVNNIAAILKAYPKTKLKIGGYTDRTGNAVTNKKLSQARAEAVVNALKEAGVNSAQLIGAEGYGAEFATAPIGAPEEERKKDRRISVSPREK